MDLSLATAAPAAERYSHDEWVAWMESDQFEWTEEEWPDDEWPADPPSSSLDSVYGKGKGKGAKGGKGKGKGKGKDRDTKGKGRARVLMARVPAIGLR